METEDLLNPFAIGFGVVVGLTAVYFAFFSNILGWEGVPLQTKVIFVLLAPFFAYGATLLTMEYKA